jgi:hypothetical protein
LLLFLAQCGRDLASIATGALELALDLAQALLTRGLVGPQAFQLDARSLRLQRDVSAASGFRLELAFQLL